MSKLCASTCLLIAAVVLGSGCSGDDSVLFGPDCVRGSDCARGQVCDPSGVCVAAPDQPESTAPPSDPPEPVGETDDHDKGKGGGAKQDDECKKSDCDD